MLIRLRHIRHIRRRDLCDCHSNNLLDDYAICAVLSLKLRRLAQMRKLLPASNEERLTIALRV